MSYKTIVVHVDQSRHAAERIRIAADIAAAENAHLVGTAMTGISRYVFESGELSENDPMIAQRLAALRERTNQALDAFEAIASRAGVPSHERRLIDDEAGGGLSVQARYSDLMVLGQTDPDEPSQGALSDLPEYVVLNGGRPVLIVPYAGSFRSIGRRVLVAWDAGLEAARAITGALPLLKRAEQVEVVVFNSETQPHVHGEQPGADIALYLARHGLKVDVLQETTELDGGNALLSLAADCSSDLIVMGSYGHSRFREILLGGTTRTILESMTVPVLMAH